VAYFNIVSQGFSGGIKENYETFVRISSLRVGF
jgi:hypothetical protein